MIVMYQRKRKGKRKGKKRMLGRREEVGRGRERERERGREREREREREGGSCDLIFVGSAFCSCCLFFFFVRSSSSFIALFFFETPFNSNPNLVLILILKPSRFGSRKHSIPRVFGTDSSLTHTLEEVGGGNWVFVWVDSGGGRGGWKME